MSSLTSIFSIGTSGGKNPFTSLLAKFIVMTMSHPIVTNILEMAEPEIPVTSILGPLA